MFDLSLNDDFSVHLDDTNGLATVSGVNEFEQAVSIALTDYLASNLIGSTGEDTIRQRLRLQVSRVARDKDRIDDIETVNVRPSPDKPNTYEVTIAYNSSADFSTEVSE